MQKRVLLLLVAMAFFVTTIGAASAAQNDTTLALSTNDADNTINTGQSVTLYAVLRGEDAAGGQYLVGGEQITFLVDGTSIGTATTNSGGANNGRASLSYTPTTPGQKVITATYAGRSNPPGPPTALNPSTSNTVILTVNAYNSNNGVTPTANDDAVTNAVEETPFAAGVAGNDALGSGTNTWAVTTAALHGAVVMNPLDGTYTYTPTANYFGTDTFTYTLTATNSEFSFLTWSWQTVVRTDTALVTITIANVQDAPVAVDNTVTTPEDIPSGYDVLGNDYDADGDTLTITGVTQPSNGQAVNHGTYVEYIPNSNYNGPDQFTYTISDGNGGTATATVFMTVIPSNDDPEAVDDTANTNEDTPVTINVLANDSDVEGDAISVTGVTQPANGSVVLNSDGTVTYTPNSNFNGVDTFTYIISDGDETDVGMVTVNVASVPDADLVLTKKVNNAAPVVKDTVIFTLIVNNNGPETAVDVTVFDKLPAGLTYVSSVANFGTYDPTTGLWTIASLPNGASAVLTITSVVEQTGQIINQANVTALSWDPNLEGNAASVAINAQEAAADEPEVNAKTVAMQKTGAPIAVLVLAFFMLLGGMVLPKRK